ncbi:MULTISPECIES: hypothetical protein [unclassified Rhizobium]|nr:MULTISPECIES: hypothetical protein [unclassified Rhizobium]MBO9124001.1 hypothetical protein [Rhizobium sp. 16-488-2b]MBO9174533.1 hypothetical protein [Rhizobium sp. 16-488-2a]
MLIFSPSELLKLGIPVVKAFAQGSSNGVSLHPDDAQGARIRLMVR